MSDKAVVATRPPQVVLGEIKRQPAAISAAVGHNRSHQLTTCVYCMTPLVACCSIVAAAQIVRRLGMHYVAVGFILADGQPSLGFAVACFTDEHS